MNSKRQYMIRNEETGELLSSIIFEDKESVLNYITNMHLENAEILSRSVTYSDWKLYNGQSEQNEVTNVHFAIFERIVRGNIKEVADLITESTPLSEEKQNIIKATWKLEESQPKLKMRENNSLLSNEYHYYYYNGYVRQVKVCTKELEFDYILEDTIIDTLSLFKLVRKYGKSLKNINELSDDAYFTLA